tara:strand:+ start:249 stop:920 length:672 start_codon:yes stop_codon:yes gene_type:complete
MKQLAKAVLAVMEDVKGVDKSMTVGTGVMSYKGVSDKDVKTAIGRSMQKNGLTLLPIGVEDNVQIDRWEEVNGQYTKQKQNINVSVKTKYLLLHESGESQEVVGYGHGIDPQDKAAGKATTYALKNLLLYMFLVPTGTIDDTDTTHSDDMPIPKQVTQPKPQPKVVPKAERIIVSEGDETYLKIVKAVSEGKATIQQAIDKYSISEDVEDSLKDKIQLLAQIV